MKLVQALHGKKNIRAKQKGYPTNLCIKKATDANYDATVDYMIDHLDGMAIFLGSEKVLYNLIEHMKSKKEVDTKDERIHLANLRYE
jgi:proline dehydrogenase